MQMRLMAQKYHNLMKIYSWRNFIIKKYSDYQQLRNCLERNVDCSMGIFKQLLAEVDILRTKLLNKDLRRKILINLGSLVEKDLI